MVQTLKLGGHFVCKLFEATLPGTMQVLALLACAFDRVALVKPVTSRPASAERYVVRRAGGAVADHWHWVILSVTYFPLLSMHAHNQVCLGRRELVGADGTAVDRLLEGMLLRAQEGHTDGYEEHSGEVEGQPQSSSLVQRARRLMTGEDGVFGSWLRALNDRMMRCQLEACHAIWDAIERAEGEEEEEEEDRGVPIDVQAYLTAWGLDVVQKQQSNITRA